MLRNTGPVGSVSGKRSCKTSSACVGRGTRWAGVRESRFCHSRIFIFSGGRRHSLPSRSIAGELAALIERIKARPRERLSAWLIQDDDGKPLGTFGLRSRFDKARKLAGVEFQFRDIRAKAATDTGDLAHSQKLLGHRNREMTEHYVRQRVGDPSAPSSTITSRPSPRLKTYMSPWPPPSSTSVPAPPSNMSAPPVAPAPSP